MNQFQFFRYFYLNCGRKAGQQSSLFWGCEGLGWKGSEPVEEPCVCETRKGKNQME